MKYSLLALPVAFLVAGCVNPPVSNNDQSEVLNAIAELKAQNESLELRINELAKEPVAVVLPDVENTDLPTDEATEGVILAESPAEAVGGNPLPFSGEAADELPPGEDLGEFQPSDPAELIKNEPFTAVSNSEFVVIDPEDLDPEEEAAAMLTRKQSEIPRTVSFDVFISLLSTESPESLSEVLNIRKNYDEGNQAFWSAPGRLNNTTKADYEQQIVTREKLFEDIVAAIDSAPEAIKILRAGIDFRHEHDRERIAELSS